MIQLTYWERPRYNLSEPDDDAFDEIFTVHLKSVKQIPELVAHKPKNCAMISTQHSAERTMKNGRRSNFFKQVWRLGEPYKESVSDKCPLCGHKKTV